MSITVESFDSAWKLISQLHPETGFTEDSNESGTFFPDESISDVAFIQVGENDISINYADGHRLLMNIGSGKNTSVTIGLIEEKKVLPSITINEVKEYIYENVVGFVYEALDDGKPGIIYHMKDGTTVSFHANEIAYTLMK